MTLEAEDVRHLAQFSVDNALDGLLWLDADGRIGYANSAACRALDGSPDDLRQKTLFEIAPDLNPDLWRELWKELRSRGSFSFEFALKGLKGRSIMVDVSVLRFEIAQRDLACLYFRDIEGRARLQALEQEFVSTVSHELRTPLTVIREGVAQVLEGLRGAVNDQQRRALTIALTGIDRLSRMIGDLLDLSKIEAGKANLRRERMDLAALAREVAAGFQTMAQERRIDLRVTTPAGPATLFADRDRLIQVLTNLINNAFKFTETGHIDIRVGGPDDTVECAVEDTGVGIASEDLSKIFNQFEQLGRISVTGESGTGLGLSICKAIIELHKGRIWAESIGAKAGSRFVFCLPRQSAREVFREQVSAVMKEVVRRGGSLSTIHFSLRPRDSSAVFEADVAAAQETIENLLHQHRGRRPDVVVRDARDVYVALPSTVGREAARVAEEIERDLLSAPDGGTARLQLRHEIVGFPEDAAQEADFLNQAAPLDGR
ncbi:MAG TPA: PAS domain-containing sensor histidine kinase [Elusimicrobiota bacterium]|nr:PAS domain-containing sensor histidine kinase [Elusimicrobiota bacterium]